MIFVIRFPLLYSCFLKNFMKFVLYTKHTLLAKLMFLKYNAWKYNVCIQFLFYDNFLARKHFPGCSNTNYKYDKFDIYFKTMLYI